MLTSHNGPENTTLILHFYSHICIINIYTFSIFYSHTYVLYIHISIYTQTHLCVYWIKGIYHHAWLLLNLQAILCDKRLGLNVAQLVECWFSMHPGCNPQYQMEWADKSEECMQSQHSGGRGKRIRSSRPSSAENQDPGQPRNQETLLQKIRLIYFKKNNIYRQNLLSCFHRFFVITKNQMLILHKNQVLMRWHSR